MTSQWGGPVRSHDKLNTYLQLQKSHGHQRRQVADLQWGDPILKATQAFDHVTNVKSSDNMKNVYFHYHKAYG